MTDYRRIYVNFIFKAKEPASNLDNMVVCDVDTDYTGRFAVVSSSEKQKAMEKPKVLERPKATSSKKKSMKKQVSKQSKLGADEAVDQMVSDMLQVNSIFCKDLLYFITIEKYLF